MNLEKLNMNLGRKEGRGLKKTRSLQNANFYFRKKQRR